MGVVGEHTATIGGASYTTRLFPASEGLELGRRIARLIDTDKLGQALLALEDSELAAAITDPAFLLELFVSAADRTEPGELSELLRDLLKRTQCDKLRVGEREVPGSVYDNFDSHFAGRYGHLLEVVVWALRVGFGEP